jgi:hypothetical protein
MRIQKYSLISVSRDPPILGDFVFQLEHIKYKKKNR